MPRLAPAITQTRGGDDASGAVFCVAIAVIAERVDSQRVPDIANCLLWWLLVMIFIRRNEPTMQTYMV